MDFYNFKEKSRKYSKINSIQSKINSLKAQLAEDDYKIIKCVESYFIDDSAPLPYDIYEMAEERNAIRAQINDLEAQIAELKAE